MICWLQFESVGSIWIYDNSKQEECSHLMPASLVYSKSVIECLLHCLLNIRDAFF